MFLKNKNCTIVHYPSYAGGNFISNCLSLSKHYLIKHKDTIDFLISNPTDYEYRLKYIISTLPKTKNEMSLWISKYEFGCIQAYGNVTTKWHNGKFATNNTIAKIVNSNIKFPITTHDLVSVSNVLKVWPEATVITLVNYSKFQKLAAKAKGNAQLNFSNETSSKYNILRGDSWPSWSEFQRNGYNINKCLGNYNLAVVNEINSFYPTTTFKKHVVFDIDSCIFDKDVFLSYVKQLYLRLQLDDFNKELIEEYYTRYITLHKE